MKWSYCACNGYSCILHLLQDCGELQRLLMPSCDVPSTPKAQEQSCSSKGSLETSDWQSVLCVHTDNNPDQGPTYSTIAAANSTAQFQQLRARTPAVTTYQTLTGSSPTPVQGYQQGDPILTASSESSLAGILSLPVASAGGCFDQAPVLYLMNQQNSCPRYISSATCAAQSYLDAQHYLSVGIDASRVAGQTLDHCWRPAGVLRSPSVDNSSLAQRCSATLTCMSSSHIVQPQTLDDAILFSLSELNQQIAAPPESDAVACDLAAPGLPPQPALSAGDNMCRNVLLSLEYVLRWRGSEVLSVATSVVLGQVMLETTLQQRFSVRYESVADTSTDVCSQGSSVTELSGNPGYVLGRPLLHGELSSMDSNTITINSTRLSVWTAPSTSRSLCGKSGHRDVQFGHDILSGCLLQISLDDIRERCDILRQQVLVIQEQLVSATHVSSSGSSSTSSTADWIEIIRWEQFYFISDLESWALLRCGGVCLFFLPKTVLSDSWRLPGNEHVSRFKARVLAIFGLGSSSSLSSWIAQKANLLITVFVCLVCPLKTVLPSTSMIQLALIPQHQLHCQPPLHPLHQTPPMQWPTTLGHILLQVYALKCPAACW